MRAYSVRELNRAIGQALDIYLDHFLLEGEISDITFHRSGHWYFSLVDEEEMISGIMFSSRAAAMTWEPEIGDRVRIAGRLNVYGPRGSYSVRAQEMIPAGEGARARALKKLKGRLQAEGIFSPERKQALPRFPRVVAVASSPTGAAYQDILKVLRTRAPWIQVVLAPCIVQGPQATESICQAIRQVNDWGRADVLIVTRGGGSAEDLEAYDTEAVIRAVADSQTPVVCAVGHEVDTSLSELAADRRAATPSQAAEIVSPDQQALRRQLEGLQLRSQRAMQQQVFGLRQQLRQLRPPSPLPRVQRQRLSLESMQWRSQRAMQARLQQLREQLKQLRPASPLQRLQAQRLSLEGLRWRSQHAMQLRVQQLRHDLKELRPPDLQPRLRAQQLRLQGLTHRAGRAVESEQRRGQQQLALLAAQLDALSPLKIMERGYALVYRGEELVTQARELEQGDRVRVRLSEGSFEADVTDVTETER